MKKLVQDFTRRPDYQRHYLRGFSRLEKIEEFTWEHPTGVGAFQIMTTPQFVRIDCYRMDGEDMNRFIDVMLNHSTALFVRPTGFTALRWPITKQTGWAPFQCPLFLVFVVQHLSPIQQLSNLGNVGLQRHTCHPRLHGIRIAQCLSKGSFYA